MAYWTPSIKDVNAFAGTNGLKVISTFAGTGGSSTGYKMAGFDVKVACEFVNEAVASYKANAPTTKVLQEDIRNVSGHSLLELAGLRVGELDLFDGSPPCSAFSTSGLREDAWGEEKHYSGAQTQRVDDLFFEYVRLVGEMRPKTFVAENVQGLVSGVAKGYFKEIWNALAGVNDGEYELGAQLLNAANLGVPQNRPRLIFVGVRKDLGKKPVFPKPLPFLIPLVRAVDDLPTPDPSTYDFLKPGTRTRMAYDYTDIFRDNGCFRDAYIKLFNKNARFNWFKLNPSKPCPTLTAKICTLFRWDEPRSLSLAEARRLSSFPDDFELIGTKRQQWERIGRAVPPVMMGHVGQTIAREIFGWEGRTLVDEVVARAAKEAGHG